MSGVRFQDRRGVRFQVSGFRCQMTKGREQGTGNRSQRTEAGGCGLRRQRHGWRQPNLISRVKDKFAGRGRLEKHASGSVFRCQVSAIF